MLWMLFSVVAATESPVTITNCEFDQALTTRRAAMYCDITNTGTAPIAAIRFRATVRDTGREVPWSQSEFSRELTTFAGGIEPGETLRHLIIFPGFPDRASKETMLVEMIDLEAIDVRDQPITPPKPAP